MSSASPTTQSLQSKPMRSVTLIPSYTCHIPMPSKNTLSISEPSSSSILCPSPSHLSYLTALSAHSTPSLSPLQSEYPPQLCYPYRPKCF